VIAESPSCFLELGRPFSTWDALLISDTHFGEGNGWFFKPEFGDVEDVLCFLTMIKTCTFPRFSTR
jgi:hypothetical protein